VLGSGTSLEVWSLGGDSERLLPSGGGHLGGISGVASSTRFLATRLTAFSARPAAKE